MDKRVFIIMFMAFLAWAVYFVIKIQDDSCEDFGLIIEPANPRVGDTILFKSEAVEAESMNWNFGDKDTAQGLSVTHIYSAAGEYDIIATVTEGCKSKPVKIKVLPQRTVETVVPEIDIPSNIIVGKDVTFKDNTSEASEWSWVVLPNGQKGNERVFTTTFSKVGTYQLLLSVKGKYVVGADTVSVIVGKAPVSTPRPTPAISTTPVSKPKPQPPTSPAPIVSSVYKNDKEFARDFVRIANLLKGEDNNSSKEWVDNIVSQTGARGTMKVVVFEGSRESKEMTLESFKSKLIATTDLITVVDVLNIKRASDKSILQISIKVTK